MKEKINVLVICSDRTGVAKFRSLDPHLRLQEMYSDDFFIDIITAGVDSINFTNFVTDLSSKFIEKSLLDGIIPSNPPGYIDKENGVYVFRPFTI